MLETNKPGLVLRTENGACELCSSPPRALRVPCQGSVTRTAPRCSEGTSSGFRSGQITGAITYREKPWVVCKSTFLRSVTPLCPTKASIPWIFIRERVVFLLNTSSVHISAAPPGCQTHPLCCSGGCGPRHATGVRRMWRWGAPRGMSGAGECLHALG